MGGRRRPHLSRSSGRVGSWARFLESWGYHLAFGRVFSELRERRLVSDSVDTTTQALEKLAEGDPRASDVLFPLLYDELRRIASVRLQRGPGLATLQTTELVHEAYVRLVDQTRAGEGDRAHFCALAAQVMRRILVDRSRRRCVVALVVFGSISLYLYTVSLREKRECADRWAYSYGIQLASRHLEDNEPFAARSAQKMCPFVYGKSICSRRRRGARR